MEQLQELLSDHQMFHSDLQMDHFITIRAGGTPYGQYKQALRELSKRYKAVKFIELERRTILLDLEEAETSARWFHDKRKKERLNLKIAGLRMKIEDMENTLADAEREFKRFYAQAVALKQIVGPLTAEARAKLDAEMWEHHIKKMAAVDFMSKGRVSPNVLTLAQSLPVDMQKKLRDEIFGSEDKTELLDWFWAHNVALPEASLSCETERELYEDRSRRLSVGDSWTSDSDMAATRRRYGIAAL